jgi:hypothetical protein
MSRRLYCAGTDRTCPAHAWFYYSGQGRPRERCRVCWLAHERARKLGNQRDFAWKANAIREADGAARASTGES